MHNRQTDLEVLTLPEVAVYLKVTERTIYRLAGSKRIPAFKVGGVWRFSRTEIDNWIRLQSSSDNAKSNNGRSAGGAE